MPNTAKALMPKKLFTLKWLMLCCVNFTHVKPIFNGWKRNEVETDCQETSAQLWTQNSGGHGFKGHPPSAHPVNGGGGVLVVFQ